MNRIRRLTALGIAIAALAPATAQAYFPHDGPAGDPVLPVVAAAGGSPAQPQSIVIKERNGFDWADAGMGFAAAAGLALLSAGSLVTVRSRRGAARPPS